jgi:putative transposase
MPNYVRALIPGGTFFFTVTLLDRRRSLLTDHIGELRNAFTNARQRRPFSMDAIVILPDHLHCIWTLPPDDADYPARWHDVKARFAASLPAGEAICVSRARRGERGIWQRRYWEHQIRDERDFARHVDYIHFNPVKHRWAPSAAAWPHSSFHRFVRQGLYDADWPGTPP